MPWMSIAALLGGLSVALGAFGAHALKERLSVADLAIFETAVRYQFYHALAMLAVPPLQRWAAQQGHELAARRAGVAAAAWLVGILLFSGSLYLLVATGVRKLGMVTPLGGTALLFGWLWFARAAWRLR